MMTTAERVPSRPARRRDNPDVRPVPRPSADESESRMEEYPPVRVLVIFEGAYRAYGAAIAGALGDLRPRAEVAVAEPADIRAEVVRLSPHLVISSQPNAADPARTLAWVELPNEPGLAGKICFDGECLEVYDLALDDLLEVIDRAEALVRA